MLLIFVVGTTLLVALNGSTPAGACFPGGQLVKRRPRREKPFMIDEHVPNTPENSVQAAGRPEKPIRGSADPRYADLVENLNENIEFLDKDGEPVDRKMSRRCKEKLDTLAMLVMNQWPGVKVRVLRAWVQNRDFRPRVAKVIPNSLLMHYEGRAVDLTTSDVDRSKNGVLARLAVQAGFDWVHYEHKYHIHASVKSDILSRTTRSLRCFPASSMVNTEYDGPKLMSDLRVGDRVMSLSSDALQLVYSPVVGFLHVDSRRSAYRWDYAMIRTMNGTMILLSPDHLLAVVDKSSKTWWPNKKLDDLMKPARKARRGDFVLVAKRTTGGLNFYYAEQIVDVQTEVPGVGLYAPLTGEGTLVVDSVVTSCYAGVKSHATAHVALGPLRFYYSHNIFGTNSTSSGQFGTDRAEQYVNWYAGLLWRVADFIESTNLYSFWNDD